MGITVDEARAFLATLDIQRDTREPVAEGRRPPRWRTFKQGWGRWGIRPMTERTLQRLTWGSLGYRARAAFESHDPEAVFEAFRAAYASDGPITPRPRPVTRMYDFDALLDRLQSADRPVAFVVGAPLSVTFNPAGGVPDVRGMIERVEAWAKSRGIGKKLKAALANVGDDIGARYQAAFDFVDGRRGHRQADRLVRAAVCEARLPDAPAQFTGDGRPEHWHLPKGTAALGRLLVEQGERFTGPVITTNFDPLISLAITAAGGRPQRLVLTRDGALPAGDEADDEADGGVTVVHLHGYWRGSGTPHRPHQLIAQRPRLAASLRAVLRDHIVVVLAFGGWDDVVLRALAQVSYEPGAGIEVLWTLFGTEPARSPNLDGCTVYRGIDAHRLLPALLSTEPTPVEAVPGADRRSRLTRTRRETIGLAQAKPPPGRGSILPWTDPPPSHTVFLCYAGPDRPLAERLHRALAAADVRAWCDAIDLIPGQRWSEEIPKALTASRIMLLLITDRWPTIGEAGSSHYTRDELALALDHARANRGSMQVVPARLDGVGADRVPYGLNDTVPIMASSDDFGPIVHAMRRLLDAPLPAPPEPRPVPSAGPLADAERALDARRAEQAPRDVIAAAERRVLALKRNKRQRHKPVEGLHLCERWTLLERLGRGGFAEVWKAWDGRLKHAVAVKMLHGQFEDSAERRERFFRGARQMARIDHPNVVRVFDPQAEHDGFHFFVMEWVPGGDLHHAVVDGRVDVKGALRAIVDVAGALSAAHELGIIHRDVKPANILLTADGRAKLTDFDLVRAGDTTGGTRTGALGTFIYAAPEAMEDGSKVTPACDVYSLGMTALFALHGGPLPREVLRRPEAVLDAAQRRATERGEPDRSVAGVAILEALDWAPSGRPPGALILAALLEKEL